MAPMALLGQIYGNGVTIFQANLATHLQVRQVVITGHIHPLGKTPKLSIHGDAVIEKSIITSIITTQSHAS